MTTETPHLLPAPETVHWGYFDAALPPRLTIDSGDTVTITSVSGGPDQLPPPGFHVPPGLLDIHARSERMLPGHILTGPVAIRGAEPGDVLAVEILAVAPAQDWGYNLNRPLAGTLPDDFPNFHQMIIPLDRARGIATLPWGLELPLKPFFGVMGVAPPPAWGRLTTIIPRAFGGNMDNKELVAGATLYLPVFVPGALFSCGDGHGAQGDGEVNVTAIETALTGTFRLTVQKRPAPARPYAETPTHLVTMAFDPDLDRAAEVALRDLIAIVVNRTGLRPVEAYALASLAADLRITQTVNQHKGVHCMIARQHLQPRR